MEMRREHKLAISVEVCGTGCNTISLIAEAAKIVKSSGINFDQIWCVFDKDDFPADNFDNAINKANSHGFRLAWSNECFELWYLLHFRYTTAHLPRESIYRDLTSRVEGSYEKNRQGMYKFLLPEQKTAIKNAKKLEVYHIANGSTPSGSNPLTKVYELVEELISQIEE